MSLKRVWGRVLAVSLAGCLWCAAQPCPFAQSDKSSKTDAKAPAASQEQAGQQGSAEASADGKTAKTAAEGAEDRKSARSTRSGWTRTCAGSSPTKSARAFKQLSNDEERDQFIEQFWLRRDPTPDTAENEYKEEHYRRIAYANEHFAAGMPGWRTDRGRIYIMYGKADEIESHPSGGYY